MKKSVLIKIVFVLIIFLSIIIFANKKVFADYDFGEISSNGDESITAKLVGDTLTIFG